MAETKCQANEEEEKTTPEHSNPVVFHGIKRNLEEEPGQVTLEHEGATATSEYQPPEIIQLGVGVDTRLAEIELSWCRVVEGEVTKRSVVNCTS